MTDIALRDYGYEVEAMIDDRAAQEAIAHSLYILNYFPKNVDLYRMLGNAFIENNQFSEAIDIMRRLLSAVPDNIDAHRGISTAYQKVGNLDAAIWHMKRAFELQPSNKEIQEKLRQLYETRDGEVPKIRLTRAALARMYTLSDQNEQAIAEIRSALFEDPNRLDLQVLLAQIYQRLGKMSDSADTCIEVLKKLPESLEANCILAQILEQSGQKEESLIHWQRVKELDPYDKRLPASISGVGPSADLNSLSLFEGLPEVMTGIVSQPDWSNMLGIEPSPLVSAEEKVVRWQAPIQEVIVENQDETPLSVEEPEMLAWLQETPPGASDTVGNWLAEQTPAHGSGSAADGVAEEVGTDDEIPEWLRDISTPSKTVAQVQDSPENPALEDNEFDWMKIEEPLQIENIPNVSITEEEVEKAENFPEKSIDDTVVGDLPDWLKSTPEMPVIEDVEEDINLALGMQVENKTDLPASDLPDWLLEMAKKQIADAGDEILQETEAIEAEKDIPDWLRGLEESLNEQPVKAAKLEQELPDWLKGLDELTEEKPIPEEQSGEDLSDLMKEIQGTMESRPFEELPDWLKDVQEMDEPAVVEAEAVEEHSVEELPDWLKDVQEMAEPAVVEAEAVEERPVEELPDWLKDVQEMAEPAVVEAEAVEERPVEELPDWLKEVQEMAEPAVVKAEAVEERPVEELPDWLKEVQEMAEPPALEAGAAEERPVEELPDWLKEVQEMAEPAAVEAEAVEERPVEELPDWLKDVQEMAEPQAVEAEAVEERPVEELPDWLKEVQEMAEPLALEAGAAEERTVEELPDWLKEVQEMAEPLAAEAEAVEERPVEELPDWLKEIQEMAEPSAVQTETVEDGPVEELPDWLIGVLPEIQEIEEVQKTEVAPFAEPLEAKSFILEMPTTEEFLESYELPIPSLLEDLPDWLKEITELSAETPENEIFIEQISEGELPSFEGIELDTQQVPKFESVGDAIDWLEEITAAQESQDEQALMEELSEEIKSAPVSPPHSGWILESTAPKMEISSGTEGDFSLSKQININKAKLIELENLPGLGFRTAQNILNYRQTHGNITSFDELRRALRDEHAFVMARKSIRFDEEDQNEEPPSINELKALLVQAQNAVDQEQFDVALENYQYMIQFNSMLNEVMDGLKQAVELNPHSSHLWQTLGDVYLRSDHLQEALDAFNKAESLLK